MLSDRARGVWTWLRGLTRSADADRELDEELAFHIEKETEAGVEAGLDPDEARRRALVRFGGVGRHRESARATRRIRLVDELGQDLRLAFRLLAKDPWFGLAAVATLALGIGANTAIFSVVDAVLLAESPFPDPDRLVMVWETDRASDTHHEPASWPDVADFRERSETLSEIGAFFGQEATLLAVDAGLEDPERVNALWVTPNLPSLLGVRPLHGRLFADGEGNWSSGEVVALLGEEYWRRRLGADPAVIGSVIRLDERPTRVIGVLPAGADLGVQQVFTRADYAPSFGGRNAELWLAVEPDPRQFPRQTHPFLTMARLAPGVALPAAQDELAGIAADLEAEFDVNAARGVNLETYASVVFGPVRPALLVLLGAVVLVLLVTAANVANLLLARATARAREVAVRQALGAAAGRLRRQFLVEASVLTALGAAAGVALAYGGVAALLAMAPADIPRLEQAGVDGRVLAFTAAVSLLVALVFGLLPSLQARRLDVHETLKAQPGRRVSEGRSGRRFRSALVVAEVALAVSLVIGAGLLLRSFWQLRAVDPGFQAAGLLKAEYQLPDSRYPRDFSRWPDLPEINGFHTRFLEEVRSLPGVASAAVAWPHPLNQGFTNSFEIAGREAESANYPEIRCRFISPGYPETVGVPVLAGRAIRPGDDVDATPVAMVNRAAAERYFPDGSPIGQVLRFWGIDWQIVGVIGNERFNGVDEAAEPAVYASLAQAPMQRAALLVRVGGGGAAASVDPTTLVPSIRRRFREMDPQLALFGVEPLQATLAGSLSGPRFTASLLALFAAVAILLALIGVHGVLSYAVARRAPEVGIRLALGASRRDVVRDVVGEGLALAALGVVLGVAGAFAASRVLGSLVFGVTARDPATFGAVAGGVLVVATLTSLLPAVRASRADPISSLRAE